MCVDNNNRPDAVAAVVVSPNTKQRKRCSTTTTRWTLSLVQVLSFLANCLFLGSFFGCHMVYIPIEYIDGDLALFFSPNISSSSSSSSMIGMGLMRWEYTHGECTSIVLSDTLDRWNATISTSNSNNNNDDIIFYIDNNNMNTTAGTNNLVTNETGTILSLMDVYLRVTGWEQQRRTGCATLFLSWLLWICLLTLSCFACHKGWRILLGLVLLLLFPIIKAFYWTILSSDFCDEYPCTMGRSAAWLQGCSLALDVVAGIALIMFTADKKPIVWHDPNLPPECDTMDNVRTLEEEERHRDGFNNAREVPVDISLVDSSLVHSTVAVASVPPTTTTLMDTAGNPPDRIPLESISVVVPAGALNGAAYL